MNIASCLGLTKLIDDEEKIERFIRSTVKDGKILEGYSGNVTINNWFSNLQIIHNALKQPDGNYTITDSYLHSTGNALWHFRVHPGSIDPPDYTELEKRVLITRADGTGGMGVLDLLNADVLPALLKLMEISRSHAASMICLSMIVLGTRNSSPIWFISPQPPNVRPCPGRCDGAYLRPLIGECSFQSPLR